MTEGRRTGITARGGPPAVTSTFCNIRTRVMYISLTTSQENGFKRWADAHRPDNDDDNPGGATPIAVTEPPADNREAVEEPPERE